jgi:hypothetical protein
MMERRIWYGALAAACAAALGLDIEMSKQQYPLMHALFDGQWQAARNLLYGFFTICGAMFGFLALNLKVTSNGKGGNGSTKE